MLRVAAGKPAKARGRKRETLLEKQSRAAVIAKSLDALYGDIECPLAHRNHFELLVAVILSAQCTDAAVNKVTPALFDRFPTPRTLANAPLGDIESLIRSLGLFRAKAISLRRCGRQLVDEFNGRVPTTMEELTGLAGVGRKTANVMLGHAFNQPAIAVDTHCKRLAQRLGLTREKDPNKIERDLSRLLPPSQWTGFSHRLILHGRSICHARKPSCAFCLLADLCPSRSDRADSKLDGIRASRRAMRPAHPL